MAKRRATTPSYGSHLEARAKLLLTAAGLPEAKREARILAPRRFRFDFAWHKYKVALEVHGGQYTRGRHQTATGFAKDRVKMNLAQLAGWIVIEACTEHVKSGEFVEWVEAAIETRR